MTTTSTAPKTRRRSCWKLGTTLRMNSGALRDELAQRAFRKEVREPRREQDAGVDRAAEAVEKPLTEYRARALLQIGPIEGELDVVRQPERERSDESFVEEHAKHACLRLLAHGPSAIVKDSIEGRSVSSWRARERRKPST